MTMLARHDPFNRVLSLSDMMNQLLESSFVTPRRQFSQSTQSFPIDVYETDDAFVVKAFVPGLLAEQIQISVEQDMVTIAGESNLDTPQQVRVLHNEIPQGRFTRVFRLPLPIDADNVEAKMDNGVLFLALPKVEAVKPRKIQVKAA